MLLDALVLLFLTHKSSAMSCNVFSAAESCKGAHGAGQISCLLQEELFAEASSCFLLLLLIWKVCDNVLTHKVVFLRSDLS